MRRLMLRTALLTVVGIPSIFAQTFTGTWQGALKAPAQMQPQPPNGELRIVVKISTTEADKLKAELFSIDQGGGRGIVADKVTTSGSNLSMSIAPIGGTYEGKMSPDGNSITGTFTQGMPLPLNLARATPETVWTIPEPPPPPKMMAPDAKPSFEVATIKPSRPEERFSIQLRPGGKVNTTGTTLSDLLRFAYDVHPKQISGAPAWVEAEKYDIEAKPDTPGLPNVDQMKIMMQKLLVERFALSFHREKKDLSVYAISVAKGGPKMAKEENNPVPVPGFGGPPQRGFNVRNATIAEFATVMQAQFMEQPVVDQTGLGEQRFNFVLKWTPDPSQRQLGGAGPEPNAPAAAPDADAPPDLFTAMQQQLGLQMKSTKAPVDVLMIDKVSKPSEN